MIFNKEKIRLLLSKPTLADNSDIEKKATWLELYFDLFFVAIIGVISHHFAHLVSYEWSWIALMRVVIEIVTLTWIWSSITYFFDRYESKGLTKRLFFLVQMFILAMLGLTIEPGLDVMGDRFFGLYGFSKLLLAGLYLRGRDASHPDAIKRIDNKNLVGNVLAFVLALIGIFVTPVWSLLFFILALSIDILLPLTVSHTGSKWSLVHLEKFAERFGLFIIIVLGESIVGVIGGSAGSEYISREMIIMIIGAVLLSFGHRWMYFDFVGRSVLKPATMYSRAYLHIPLVVCYTLIGAALLMIVSHASHPPEHAIALLTAGVLGVILLITALERLVGNHVHGYRVDRGSSLQLLLSGIGIVIVWVLPLSIIVHLWLVTALIFVPIVARLLGWLRTPLQKTDPDPLTTPPIGNNGVVSPDSLGEIDMRSQPK